MRSYQHGPTFVEDPTQGTVAEFNVPYPGNPYLLVGPQDAFDTVGSFTLAFEADRFESDQYMFRKITDGIGWELQGNTFFMNDGVSGIVALSLGEGTQVAGWHHVAIVVDTTNDEMRVYIDGDTNSPEVAPIPSGFDCFAVGSGGDGLIIGSNVPENSYKGRMDNVVFANRAFSTDEITNLYEDNVLPVAGRFDVYGHWKFEGNWDDSGTDGHGAIPWSDWRSWPMGDFDGDDDVDQIDLAQVTANTGTFAVMAPGVDVMATADTTPTLTGSVNAIYDNVFFIVTVGSESLTTTISDGTWTTVGNFSEPLSSGSYDVEVTITYLIGEQSFVATEVYTDALTIL
jgi:hypothetical protein